MKAHLGTAAVSATYTYSADQAYLAVTQTSADAQHITLWKTAATSVIVDHRPPEHTTVASVAWGALAKGKKGTQSTVIVLAICLSNGQIQLLSALDGKVMSTLTGAHSSPVNDFVFVPNTTSAYSCGQDDWIVKWNVTNGTVEHKFKVAESKASPQKLGLSPDASLLAVCDSSVTLFSTADHRQVARFPAHASSITTACFTADGRRLLTAASADRFVNVYDLANPAHPQPLPALSLDANVVTLAVAPTDQVAVLAEDGTLGLWSSAAPPTASSGSARGKKKRTKYSARVPEATWRVEAKETQETVPMTSVAFVAEPEPRVLFTRGASLNPVFEALPYLENGELLASETLIRSTQTAHLVGAAQSTRGYRQTPGTAVVHAGDTDFAKPQLASSTAVNGTTDEQNQSLAERLAQLKVVAAPNAPASATGAAAGKPDVTSLHVILTQALHSSDQELLETVLGTSSLTYDMIMSTVRKLPTAQVVPFLSALMARFQRRHTRADHLLDWIRAVIIVHCGYLLTVPDLVRKLSAFYHVLEARVNTARDLVKLQGRLELVLSQMELQNTVATDDSAMLIVNEDDEDDDEAADGMYEDLANPSRGSASTLRHVQRRATLEQLGEDVNGYDDDEEEDSGDDDVDEMAVDSEKSDASDEESGEEDSDASGDEDEDMLDGLEDDDEDSDEE
ncbi:WD repeat-containing protein 43 [Allomyces arbusculus]|nr:WD repeat-containing protein 43 [Allomyces arbusculus]